MGNVGMSAEQLVQNVEAFVAALRKELPSWDRVSRITLHATRGPAFTLHSAKRQPATTREEQDECKQLEQLVEVCHEGSSSLRFTGQDHRAGWAAVGIAAPWSLLLLDRRLPQ